MRGSAQFECPRPDPLPATGRDFGCDVGLRHHATVHNGAEVRHIDVPKPLAKAMKRLKRLQTAQSRRKKGTKRRQRAAKRVANLHRKIANWRRNSDHQTSHRLTAKGDCIGIETLSIAAMAPGLRLGRALADAGLGQFLDYVRHKADWHGRFLHEASCRCRSANRECWPRWPHDHEHQQLRVGLPGADGLPLLLFCIQSDALSGRSHIAGGGAAQCSPLCRRTSWFINPKRPTPPNAATGTADEEAAAAGDGTMGNAISADGASIGLAGRQRMLWGGAFGHFIEWYDWAIYGFLAGVFASQMFPAANPAASLIASFSAFAVGFLGRPVGAFVLSPLADKYGRRIMLSATIVMAGLGSLVIALCPTYAQVGIAAPLLIVAARLLQGFSAGGEYQIAITFLNEHAGTRNRAFAASPQQVSIGVSVLVATAVATLTTKHIAPDDLARWGWRLPFLLGAALSLFGFWLRSGLAETPTFEQARRDNARAGRTVSAASIAASIAKHPREVFIVFVVQLNGLQYYLWMIFLPTYANMVGGLDRASGFAGSVLASLAYCVGVPTFAFVSDRIGRKPFLIGAAVCFLLFTYPLLSMLAVPSLTFATFAFVAVVGALFVSLNNAVIGTVFAELFPTEVRASGIGIPYAVCAAIFGGTAPMAATWLNQVGGPLYISLYVMLVCVVTLATHLVLTPETRGRPLG